MALKLMYITNNPLVAQIAENNGVDRIWVDLETLGKKERQNGLDTVQSTHVVEDVSKIRSSISKAELLVRVNPINSQSEFEINEVIARGADIVMLPMFRTAKEVQIFINLVDKRAKTLLLLETAEAVKNLEEILRVSGIDEIHIGLNDLHLAYGMDFMFELITNGQVEGIVNRIAAKGIPYGFGGIARLDEGMVPARHIIAEHYRLGSSMAILSRSFYDSWLKHDEEEIEKVFSYGMAEIREFEERLLMKDSVYFEENRRILNQEVEKIAQINRAKKKQKVSKPKHVLTEEYKETPALYQKLIEEFGGAFYLLDGEQFKKNYIELKEAFTSIYPEFNIAYSYKTNYTPALCRIVDDLGGYAEVVSDMEMEIALRIGVDPHNIIWNGPYKNYEKVEQLLIMGGSINIDSEYEINFVKDIAQRYPDSMLHLGIRCNFDVNDGVLSRFGIDVESELFMRVLNLFDDYSNIEFTNLQCHFATRTLETWSSRIEGMLNIVKRMNKLPKRIDLGGGLFGKMADSLKAQFNSRIPTYQEYAESVATVFADFFSTAREKPMLLIEPGSALVGDCMHFAAKVVNIKNVRGKSMATLLGSIYNINPTLNKKNPPIRVLSMGNAQSDYEDLDFGGFTCIESDYLYRNYTGKLAVGDMVIFGNVGSYSIVLKPPFILPNFPVLGINNGPIVVEKRGENFDDLFHTFTV